MLSKKNQPANAREPLLKLLRTMNPNQSLRAILFLIWVACQSAESRAVAQLLTLTGTNYSQDFDGIGSGLPEGWSVRTAATASSLGTVAAFSTAAAAWKAASAGTFANFASVTNNDGTPFISSEDATTQAAATNRAPGIRLSNGTSPGTAFVLGIANTLGLTNLVVDLDILTLNMNSRLYSWHVETAVGAAPASFTFLEKFVDSNSWGASHLSFALPNSVSDQGDNLWIRIAVLTNASTTGAHDTFGVDNFSLAWSVVTPSTNRPTISAQPASLNRNASASATFAVTASGGGTLHYQWRKGGTDLVDGGNVSGANISTLTVSAVYAADAGGYSVFITNNHGSVTGEVATLTVNDPVVLASPASRTNLAGEKARLTANAAGTLPLSYQWRRNGVDLTGESGTFLANTGTKTITFTNLQSAQQGGYAVVISNALGVVTSSVANLVLYATPSTRLAGWNFNSDPDDGDPLTGRDMPSFGTGTAMFLGTTPGYNGGSFSDPISLMTTDNSAWSLTTFPPQGTENKLRGVQFTLSTAGYKDILLTWEEQNTGRASRYLRVQYTTNGTDFIDHDGVDLGGRQNEFTFAASSFATIPTVNNNANFAVRIVAEWQSTATGSGADQFLPTDPAFSYGQNNAIRFDMVNVFGNVIGANAPINLTSIQLVGSNVRIEFTADTGDTPGTFALQSSSAVNGAYGDVSSTITQLGSGSFRAERAWSGTQQFYLIRR
jgi:hypothetical protein